MGGSALFHRRGAYLADKCRKKSSTWSLPVGSPSDPLTEIRRILACTPNELCLPGQGAVTFSIKGQTVNIVSSQATSGPCHRFFCLFCVCVCLLLIIL